MLLFKTPKPRDKIITRMVPKLTSGTLPSGYSLDGDGFTDTTELWHLFDDDSETSATFFRSCLLTIDVPEYFIPRSIDISYSSTMSVLTTTSVAGDVCSYLTTGTTSTHIVLNHKSAATKKLNIRFSSSGSIPISSIIILGYKLGGAT